MIKRRIRPRYRNHQPLPARRFVPTKGTDQRLLSTGTPTRTAVDMLEPKGRRRFLRPALGVGAAADAYSICKKTLSQQLPRKKIEALHSRHPEWIATANIGCQRHLESGTHLPVHHWIELLDNEVATGSV